MKLRAFWYTLLDYMLPAVLVYLAGVAGYGILVFARLLEGIDLPMTALLGLVGFVLLFAWLAQRRNWRQRERWVVQLGSRQGLTISRLPLLDMLLLLGCFIGYLLLRRDAPQLVGAALYLFVPLALALAIHLLTGRPDPLEDVICKSIAAETYAQEKGLSYEALLAENGWKLADNPTPPALPDATNPPAPRGPQLRFGQRVRLPASKRS
ncbi:MAG: hypothetical protein GYB64_05545 [Chloroflexi bacterium]|nr:hypothetical protein [Chloroflexota bacterium]